MICQSCKLFPKNLKVIYGIPLYNISSRHKLLDSIIIKKFFSYSFRINSHGYRFQPSSSKLFYSSASQPFSETKVDFVHIPVRKDLVNNLKSLGIRDLRLFQYIILKVLNDNLKSEDAKTFSRLIFYHDLGSGQSIGTFLALLNIYSSPLSNEISQEKPPGSLLVLCTKNSISKISNLILGINPSLKLLVLDEGTRGENESSNHTDSGSNNQTSSGLMSKILKENLLSREDPYDLILTSHSYFPKISIRKKTFNFPLLSLVSCILFEDFSDLIDSDTELFNHNIKLVRESKKHKYPEFESKRDFHIICLINSLNDKFAEYSRKYLSNYSLYDFKYGTKQRLMSDDKTDILKVDVDFGEAEIINLQTEENYENKTIEHSICKVSKKEKYDRLTVLKNLVYSYLDLPTFISSQSFPMCLKKPTAKAKCIIFVSNRNQINKVANTQEFSNLSVYLGRHLNVYERAKSISSFNNGSKPIMIATDHSICGSTFEDVSYIFNFNPPKTSESYKSRVGFCRKRNTLCVTLYSKDQYHSLVKVIKECTKKVSVHIVPSEEYMVKHDMNWLRKFTKEMITENKNTISPYMGKAEDLLARYGDSIISRVSNMLLRDRIDVSSDTPVNDGIISRSILSGKEGFTPVEIKDESKQYLKDEFDLKKLLLNYFPESKVNSIIGRSHKTEYGYIIDVPNNHMKNIIQLSKDNQDLYVQVPTHIPKIMVNLNNTHIGKIHRKGIDHRSIKIRKPPRIEDKINVNN